MFGQFKAVIRAFYRISDILGLQVSHRESQADYSSRRAGEEYFFSKNKILPYSFGGMRYNLENIEGFKAFAEAYSLALHDVFDRSEDVLEVCLESLRIKNLTAVYARCSPPLKLEILRLISLNLPQAIHKSIPTEVMTECRQFYAYCQDFVRQILFSGDYSKESLPLLGAIYRRGVENVPVYGSMEALITSSNHQAEWDLIQYAMDHYVNPEIITTYEHKGFIINLEDHDAFNRFTKFYKERLKRIVDGEISDLELIDVEGMMRAYNAGSYDLKSNIIDLLAINLPSIVVHIRIADELFCYCRQYYDKLAAQAVRILRNEDLPTHKLGTVHKIADRYICRYQDIDGEYIQTAYRR